MMYKRCGISLFNKDIDGDEYYDHYYYILSAFHHTHCYRNDLDVQQQHSKKKKRKKKITWSEKILNSAIKS